MENSKRPPLWLKGLALLCALSALSSYVVLTSCKHASKPDPNTYMPATKAARFEMPPQQVAPQVPLPQDQDQNQPQQEAPPAQNQAGHPPKPRPFLPATKVSPIHFRQDDRPGIIPQGAPQQQQAPRPPEGKRPPKPLPNNLER